MKKDEDLLNIREDVPIIYDFGGFTDNRLVPAILESAFLIIPMLAYRENVKRALDFIQEIKLYQTDARRIILVVNNSIRNEFETTKKLLNKHFPALAVFEIKRSKVFRRMIEDKQSIARIAASNKQYRRFFQPVADQFEAIFNYMRKINDRPI